MKSWAESDRNMTRQSGSCILGQVIILLISASESLVVDDVYWMTGQNVEFDGTTFSFTNFGDFVLYHKGAIIVYTIQIIIEDFVGTELPNCDGYSVPVIHQDPVISAIAWGFLHTSGSKN